jgi:replicative DNA helicase
VGAARFLLRKVLEGTEEQQISNMQAVLDAGIVEIRIVEAEERRVFAFVLSYFQQYGRLPSVQILQYETNFVLPEIPDDGLRYWIDETQRQYRQALLVRSGLQIAEHARAANLENAVNCLREAYTEVSLDDLQSRSLYWLDDIPRQIEEHRARQLGEVDIGINLGFDYLDRVMLGVQPADNLAIAGEKGIGKSFLAARMSLGSFLNNAVVLVFSMEMSRYLWARRMTALALNMSATNIKAGRLSLFEVNRLRELPNNLAERATDYRIIEGRLDLSASDVLSEIQLHRPSIVFIDGAYLLKPRDSKQRFGARWERGAAVCEDLRMISIQTGVPIVGVYQFSRGGVKKGIEGISVTDAIGQLSSVVLGFHEETNQAGTVDTGIIPLVSYRILEILKGREGEKGAIRLKYDMHHCSIEEDRVLRRVGDIRGDLTTESESLDEFFD